MRKKLVDKIEELIDKRLYELAAVEQQLEYDDTISQEEREQEAILRKQEVEQLDDIIMLLSKRNKVKEKDVKFNLDTVLVGAINLVIVLTILNYEKVGVITSKGLGFLMRGRA